MTERKTSFLSRAGDLELVKHFYTDYFKWSSPKPGYSSLILCLRKPGSELGKHHTAGAGQSWTQHGRLSPAPLWWCKHTSPGSHTTPPPAAGKALWAVPPQSSRSQAGSCPQQRMREGCKQTGKKHEFSRPKVYFKPTGHKSKGKPHSSPPLRPCSEFREICDLLPVCVDGEMHTVPAAKRLAKTLRCTVRHHSSFQAEQK